MDTQHYASFQNMANKTSFPILLLRPNFYTALPEKASIPNTRRALNH